MLKVPQTSVLPLHHSHPEMDLNGSSIAVLVNFVNKKAAGKGGFCVYTLFFGFGKSF